MNKQMMTVRTHPRWIAAEAKLASISNESTLLRRRENELAEVIASGPQGPSASIEALELLDGVIDVSHKAKLQSVKAARDELKTLRDRQTALIQAQVLLTQRMNLGDGEHCSLVAELARECCQAAGPEFISRMIEVRDAVEVLRAKLLSADSIANQLEQGGSLSHPIERIFGAFVNPSDPNAQLAAWMNELTKYLTDCERAAKFAA